MLYSSIEYNNMFHNIIQYYKNLIGLHKFKGSNKIEVGNNTYYTFDKIINIIKKYTQIKINILKKNKIKNKKCNDLLKYYKLDKKYESLFINLLGIIIWLFSVKGNLIFLFSIREEYTSLDEKKIILPLN